MNRFQILVVEGIGKNVRIAVALFALIWFETAPVFAAAPSPGAAKAKLRVQAEGSGVGPS
jgi:hypothetical protein